VKRMIEKFSSPFMKFSSHFDKKDIAPALLFLGFTLIAYGASRFHDGLGFLVFGLLLVLYRHPVVRWFK
jgi:hypothetical protein